MATCQYDTGSMYGCEPACSKPATAVLTYGPTGMGASHRVTLCASHVSPMRARTYPYSVTVEGV